jgi:hypothetical protein
MMAPGKGPPAGERAALERELIRARSATFEPFTLFRVPPMAGRYVNVAREGYRRGHRGATWPPDRAATTIFVFGGSTTFGYEVTDGETIPSQLADQLTSLTGDSSIAVYNFGSPNYSSVQERIRLEQLILDGHVPRVAVFVDGFDDFLWPYYGPVMLRTFAEALPRPSTTRLAATTLQAAVRRVAPGRISRLLLPGATTDVQPGRLPDPGAVIDRYLANKRLIEGICDRFDVRPLFVWQPVPCYHYDGADDLPRPADSRVRDRLLEYIRRGYALMDNRRGAEASGPAFLWLADAQVGRTERLYVDADHYTPAFSGEIARAIAEHLHGQGWLSPAGLAASTARVAGLPAARGGERP